MTHKYEGGQIVPLEGQDTIHEHYHVSYLVGEGDNPDYEDGYVITVDKDGFTVHDDMTETALKKFPTLLEAVTFCFETYKEQHPGKTISPIWGAGSPNETLEQLGYGLDWPPKKAN